VMTATGATAAQIPLSTPRAEQLGWKLSVQLFTYRRFALFEAVDHVAALGIRNVEPRSSVRFDPKRPELKVNEELPAALRREFRSRLDDRGMVLTSFFADVRPERDHIERVFEFCREMGTTTLVSEPPREAFDLLEKFAGEYQMNVAVHNHQRGNSMYWSPDEVLAVCQGRSRRIGACCDMGQWVRSGLDPVDCLKKLEGRILSFHLKDVSEAGNGKAPNVVLGTGAARASDVLAELRRQAYSGLTTIDYEFDSARLQEDVAGYRDFVERFAARQSG
jgi:L-ribulose-5-phosphate 3-epimerase